MRRWNDDSGEWEDAPDTPWKPTAATRKPLELHKFMLSWTCLVLVTLASLLAWYEGSGIRAEVDAAANDYYAPHNDASRYWGPIQLCQGLEAEDCERVENGTASRPLEARSNLVDVEAENPVNWVAMHLGVLSVMLITWVLAAALIIILGWYLLKWLDHRYPTGLQHQWLQLLRNGFLLVWLFMLAIIWVLVWHIVTH